MICRGRRRRAAGGNVFHIKIETRGLHLFHAPSMHASISFVVTWQAGTAPRVCEAARATRWQQLLASWCASSADPQRGRRQVLAWCRAPKAGVSRHRSGWCGWNALSHRTEGRERELTVIATNLCPGSPLLAEEVVDSFAPAGRQGRGDECAATEELPPLQARVVHVPRGRWQQW